MERHLPLSFRLHCNLLNPQHNVSTSGNHCLNVVCLCMMTSQLWANVVYWWSICEDLWKVSMYLCLYFPCLINKIYWCPPNTSITFRYKWVLHLLSAEWLLTAFEGHLCVLLPCEHFPACLSSFTRSPTIPGCCALIFWNLIKKPKLFIVFASPVYRTGNIHRTKLDWTTVWSFSSCSCPHLGSVQLPVAMFL